VGISFDGPFKVVGPPRELMLAVSSALGAKTFVESGTYLASTARWASHYFEKVHTVEAAENLFRDNVARHGMIANIAFHHGESPRFLREVLPSLEGPAVFWLDAHWSGGDTFGESDQCPLISELEEIVKYDAPHCLFIDDARMFLTPPPAPLPRRQWPDLDDIHEVLAKGKVRRKLMLLEDVLIAYPGDVEGVVKDWGQKYISDKMAAINLKMQPTFMAKVWWKVAFYAKKLVGRL
jgi:hypothetical protein